jgi:hypothetical protein
MKKIKMAKATWIINIRTVKKLLINFFFSSKTEIRTDNIIINSTLKNLKNSTLKNINGKFEPIRIVVYMNMKLYSLRL